ncbi:LuxR C-terminal-related transcriptional regulator [Arthrobacter glacialis]|uniref:HTH luxR-type domain-containing protein n=1 Tax=Arthrobacter glacialis TaxID=1664 RepID=A0A2S3ZUD9_ARTGL|nr:LuxR C-terminal-related transcriptional regulator [Arthrobacter glacialis]POH72592.1 hypothetical protein CVS27_14525 [Arthrobacter glacialis]
MMTSSEHMGPAHLIDRPRLCAELDKALQCRLTLIIAQAGAGKSTLLRQWAAQQTGRAIAMFRIEAADDDPARFVHRLVEALAAVDPAIAKVSALSTFSEGGLGEPVISVLVAALGRMPEVVIVVDDAQRLSNVDLIDDLGELLLQAPGNIHVVLASRADPPIALSQYRLSDELLELRNVELAFTAEEAAQLLERTTGHRLSTPSVRALHARTEGWAAGLQLAGLNLRQVPDPDAFVAAFGGSDRLVADYLAEEVLEALPFDQREILLRMSVLEDMCAGLVHAVTGRDDAQSILEQLHGDSIFLMELDSRREWYRFHHLFRDLLRSQLRAGGSTDERSILSVAADWQLARGRAKEAIEYLLRGRFWERALEAMLSNAFEVLVNGDMPTVVGWLLRVPESTRSNYIDADLLLGTLALEDGGGLGMFLDQDGPAGDQLGARNRRSSDAGFLAAQILLATRPELTAAAACRQIREFPSADKPCIAATGDELGAPQNSAGRLDVLVAGGRAFLLAGQIDQARELLVQGLGEAAAGSHERVGALSTLSLLEAWCGKVKRAESLICEALLSAREAGMLADRSVTDAYLAAVMTSLRRGDADLPAEAEPLRMPATSFPQDQEEPESLSTMLFERAVSSLTLGDPERARGIVGSWPELVLDPDPLAVVQCHILLSWVATCDNEPFEARRHLGDAVKMAEIHGLVGVFVRAGPVILRRLRDISGPQAAFRDIILAHAQQSVDPRQQALPDPLTDRELEILSYLPTRFTNVELADRCFVSVNTIKTHMVHIYRKLDATNRDAAIGRARVLGLL